MHPLILIYLIRNFSSLCPADHGAGQWKEQTCDSGSNVFAKLCYKNKYVRPREWRSTPVGVGMVPVVLAATIMN